MAKKLADENNVSENQTTSQRLDYTFVDDRIPKSFIKWVKIYYNDAKMIEEFWKMTKIAAYKNNREADSTKIVDLAISCFKQLVRKIKLTSKVQNPIAYFYGILSKKLEELYFEELYEIGVPL